MGGVFWLFVLLLVTKVLANLFQARDPLSPLYVFIALLLVWDLLFSPFGADRRVMVGFQIAVMIYAWEGLRVHAERAKQIRRIRRAARKALKPRLGWTVARPAAAAAQSEADAPPAAECGHVAAAVGTSRASLELLPDAEDTGS